MPTSNPLVPALFALAAVVLLLLTWRTVARWWHVHGSLEKYRERQLLEAQRGELMYRVQAEQCAAVADGYAATIKRLTAS